MLTPTLEGLLIIFLMKILSEFFRRNLIELKPARHAPLVFHADHSQNKYTQAA